MNKAEKKLISIVLVISVIASLLSVCISAYAKSQRLILDVLYSDAMDGSEDLLWYVYTPEVSGTYSFMSFNIPHSEAYLFTKESNETLTNKVMTQLAYSQSSPDFEARGQSGLIQFCLTYHLEAGTTYYYAAGWWSESRKSGTMNVKLTCDSYDEASIENIDLSCNVNYEQNVNGKWMTDTDGNPYFYYDLSRLITNLKITVTYKDGSVSSVVGKDEIDGNSILFTANQNERHWYPASNPDYSGNVLTVSILGVNKDFNVEIIETNLKLIRLKTVDFSTGEALGGVKVTRGNDFAYSDENGTVTISLPAGTTDVVVSDDYSMTRTVSVYANPTVDETDYTDQPIGIVTSDYNSDNVINGKDYAYIIRNFTDDVLAKETERFKKQVNFKIRDYPALEIK